MVCMGCGMHDCGGTYGYECDDGLSPVVNETYDQSAIAHMVAFEGLPQAMRRMEDMRAEMVRWNWHAINRDGFDSAASVRLFSRMAESARWQWTGRMIAGLTAYRDTLARIR